jgi:hypothetical protein
MIEGLLIASLVVSGALIVACVVTVFLVMKYYARTQRSIVVHQATTERVVTNALAAMKQEVLDAKYQFMEQVLREKQPTGDAVNLDDDLMGAHPASLRVPMPENMGMGDEGLPKIIQDQQERMSEQAHAAAQAELDAEGILAGEVSNAP